MNTAYIFTSERLGFRNWTEADISPLSIINSDPRVMQYFPSIQSYDQTESFVKRMKNQFKDKGFCYFAVDKLSTGQFIGFIGISEQSFKSEFTPAIDIGWRLSQKEWGNGYATEGAKRCLDFAFSEIGLNQVISICPEINHQSENVMKKLDMNKIGQFNHPLLKQNTQLQKCVVYELRK